MKLKLKITEREPEHTFSVRCRETGTEISTFDTLEAAKNEIARFEEVDKVDGCYVPDFYELWDNFKNEQV